jgi:hypothetical protein
VLPSCLLVGSSIRHSCNPCKATPVCNIEINYQCINPLIRIKKLDSLGILVSCDPFQFAVHKTDSDRNATTLSLDVNYTYVGGCGNYREGEIMFTGCRQDAYR